MKRLTDNFGNDQLDENGCVQYVEKEDKLYQCCSCENVFNAGQSNDTCPFCSSGNIVEGHIDEPAPLTLNDIDKETVYYALSRLLDEDMDDNEFNYISDLRDKFSVDKEQVNITYAKEGYKACAICKEYFKPTTGARLTETRHLCALCRKAGA